MIPDPDLFHILNPDPGVIKVRYQIRNTDMKVVGICLTKYKAVIRSRIRNCIRPSQKVPNPEPDPQNFELTYEAWVPYGTTVCE